MPPHLTTLPREIRDAILELCLVVGVINPYPAFYEGDHPFSESMCKPDTSLLAVNKAINAEAAEIFYGKNIWVINWSFANEDPNVWYKDAILIGIWHTQRDKIRHVRIPIALFGCDFHWDRTMVFDTLPDDSIFRAVDLNVQTHRENLLVESCRWKLKICRELGVRSVAIHIEIYDVDNDGGRSETVDCLEPLLDWVRSHEETKAGEPNPASVRSYPKVTLTGDPDIMRIVRQEWEEQWGPLNHSMNGKCDCLEGFFQPRDAKTIGKP